MKKVLLGMSGGVDSSVAAILLKKEGYEVIGATMILQENQSKQTILDAKKVCEKLEIPHHVIDFTKEFKKYVIEDFITCYQCAKTPNPCIECNRYLKFDLFYQKAKELGCDLIATGHYAKVEFNEKYKQYVVKKSNAQKKDQTYFLYQITKEILPYIIFPLGEFKDKNEIRNIAEENGLLVAKKPDSQEICFIPDNNYANYLLKEQQELPKKGKIVTKKGDILGEHQGLIYYTVGQRKGLGISYQEPLYVLALDSTKNEVIVGTEEELYEKEILLQKVHYLFTIAPEEMGNLTAKVRYRAKEAKVKLIKVDEKTMKVEFDEPQRAITPGQSIVFYLDDIVVGGAKIP